MFEILPYYERIDSTTWVYLSSLLSIALYFKFSRFWSIRNLDLIGLIVLAPGMLLTEPAEPAVGEPGMLLTEPADGQPGESADGEPGESADGYQHFGFIWLFAAGFLFLIRLLLDPTMVRRPLLEPNLSAGGLTFLGISLFLFLMANVLTADLAADNRAEAKTVQELQEGENILTADLAADDLVEAKTAQQSQEEEDALTQHGPGYPLLFWLVQVPAQQFISDADQGTSVELQRITAQWVAILSHFLVVLGMLLIGYRHFNNFKTGIATATLYLLLPYTAHLTGRVDHVLPAALLIWAVLAYRLPLLAGLLIGLAMGVNYYPIFLLPLWISFYWQRGMVRFVVGVLLMVASLVGILAFTSADLAMFGDNLRRMFGVWLPVPDAGGFWNPDYEVYRIPVLAVFLVLVFSLVIWPAQKNLGTLISASAAVMLATQFWVAKEGGLYIGWYLSLLVLTIFRPNLEDRMAMTVLREGWFRGRKAVPSVQQET